MENKLIQNDLENSLSKEDETKIERLIGEIREYKEKYEDDTYQPTLLEIWKNFNFFLKKG